eukprot:Lankesteria_metandrocarpae@DN1457_c1_g1_i1.p1
MKLIAVVVGAVGVVQFGRAGNKPVDNLRDDVPFTLDASKACHSYEFIDGEEKLVFFPTTTKMNNVPVFQGVQSDTCRPVNRFLYMQVAKKGDLLWTFDDEPKVKGRYAASSRTVLVWSPYEGCGGGGNLDYTTADGWRRVQIGPVKHHKCLTTMSQTAAPVAAVVVPKLQVDASSQCAINVTGVEAYTFLPTTTTINGHPVYQGFDNDTCDGLNRHLYHSAGTEQWNFVHELNTAESGKKGYVSAYFEVCPKRDFILNMDGRRHLRFNRRNPPHCMRRLTTANDDLA